MKEYPKIETVYARDMEGTKKLIEGVYRDATVEYLSNNTWAFTEKIDGTNVRVVWDGHKVSFYGRTDKSQMPNHLQKKLDELFSGQTNEELFEQLFQEKEAMLFGEGYGIKIQNGGLYRPDVSFILFDVSVGDVVLRREDVESIGKTFGLDIVPIVLEGTISEAVAYIKSRPKSTIGTAPMEGLVGRPKVEVQNRFGERMIVKVKACDF